MTDIQLSCFSMVAQNLNFTESAELLFMSQATLSRNISALEDELGFKLLVRSNKSVSLTPAGKVFKEGLDKYRLGFWETVSAARDVANGFSGAIRLGFLDGQMLDRRMHHTIARFQRSFPNIKVELMRGSFRELTGALYENQLDVIETISFDVEDMPGVLTRSVGPIDSLIVLPDYHPLAHKKNLSLSDFRNEPFVCVSQRESRTALENLKSKCRAAGFEPRILEVEDISTELLWVEAARGVGVANRYHMMCNSPILVERELPELDRNELVLAYHEGNANPAITQFLTVFDGVLAEDEKRLKEGKDPL